MNSQIEAMMVEAAREDDDLSCFQIEYDATCAKRVSAFCRRYSISGAIEEGVGDRRTRLSFMYSSSSDLHNALHTLVCEGDIVRYTEIDPNSVNE